MINDTGIVVGVEHIKKLYDLSIKNISKHHENLLKEKKVVMENCDGRLGYKTYAPYKAIHVGAAIPQVPQELIDQLDYNGRMFIPVGERNKNQWICLIDKDSEGNVQETKVMSVCYGALTSPEIQLQNYRKK